MNIKSDLRVMVIEVVEMVPKFFHLYSASGTAILLPFSPRASLIMPNMWHFSW